MKNVLLLLLSYRVGWGMIRIATGLARVVAGSDRQLMHSIATVFRWRLPLAANMLDHYLTGSGSRIMADSSALTRDPGFLARLADELELDVNAGRFEVPQWHLDDLDLRCALGSFTVNWQRKPSGVTLHCQGEYGWHPEELQRPTVLLHRSAARCPGAAVFDWEARAAGIEVPRRGTWLPSDHACM